MVVVAVFCHVVFVANSFRLALLTFMGATATPGPTPEI